MKHNELIYIYLIFLSIRRLLSFARPFPSGAGYCDQKSKSFFTKVLKILKIFNRLAQVSRLESFVKVVTRNDFQSRKRDRGWCLQSPLHVFDPSPNIVYVSRRNHVICLTCKIIWQFAPQKRFTRQISLHICRCRWNHDVMA